MPLSTQTPELATAKPTRVVLFGGSFDPPHKGHVEIARTLLRQKLVDQVRLVPLRQHPLKKFVSPDVHRLAMLQLAVKDSPIQIEQFELTQPGPSYTFATLRAMDSKAGPPQAATTSVPLALRPEFSWVIGSDNLASFHRWYHYQELLAEFKVWVYPRHGFAFEPLYPGMVPLTSCAEINVSSTQVRTRVAAGQSIADLVPAAVAGYIKANKLYKD